MKESLAVSVQELSERYRVFPTPLARVSESLTRGRVQRYVRKWALLSVSIKIEPGTDLRVVGPNGAGKSTLLRILARTTASARRTLRVRGRIGSLVDIGNSFSPES